MGYKESRPQSAILSGKPIASKSGFRRFFPEIPFTVFLLVSLIWFCPRGLPDSDAREYYPSAGRQFTGQAGGNELYRPNGEFVISVLKNGSYQEIGNLAFDRFLRTGELDLSPDADTDGSVTIRMTQQGGGAAHIDAVSLGDQPPSRINGLEGDFALTKVSRADCDVIDAFQKQLEAAFPAGGKDRILRLRARVEAETISKTPFLFPLTNLYRPIDENSDFYTYTLDSQRAGFDFDRPFFKEFSRTGSGHPSGYTYGWVANDAENLYVKIDFTPDNTMDGEKDYAAVYVKTDSGIRELKASVPETRWGEPSFTYTDKASYQHKVYGFTIPLEEIGGKGQNLLLAFSAYGTAAVANPSILYGTTGNGSVLSDLVELNPNTGQLVRTIGPVGYTVNGLEFDTTTGILYGSTSVGSSYNGLIQIDLATGAGTPVGVHGWGLGDSEGPGGDAAAVTNITISSNGQMYGWWDPSQDDLVIIDKSTGIATRVGESGTGTAENGLDFNASDTLYMVDGGGSCYTVDTGTGAATFAGSISRTAHHGDFDPVTGIWYGLDVTLAGAKNLVLADLSAGTFTTLPTIDNLHTVTFGSFQDSDGDGMTDWWEIRYGLDPTQDDSGGDQDHDGITNLDEFLLHTDPNVVDTDGDGIDDGEEIVAGEDGFITNPAKPDTDGDGLPDGYEILVGKNPTHDSDGLFRRVTNDPAASDQPDVAVDSQGNFHVVWADNRSGSDMEIFYKMLAPAGTVLIGDTRITADDGYDSVRPVLAVDSQDRVFVVWHDRRLGNVRVFLTRLEPYTVTRDGGPADPSLLKTFSFEGGNEIEVSSATSGNQSTPRLRIDASDNLHIVWEDHGVGAIKYRKLNPDGSPLIAELAVSIAGSGYLFHSVPDLALDSSGNVHVSWNLSVPYGDDEIFYALLNGTTGATLITSTQMTENDGYDSKRQSINVDSTGKAYIVWQDKRFEIGGGSGVGGSVEVFFMKIDPSLRSSDGIPADANSIKTVSDTLLTPNDGIESFLPFSRISSDGKIHITWHEGNKNRIHHMMVDTSGNAGGRIGPLTTTAYSFTEWSNAHIAAGSPNRTYLVWTDSRYGNPEIILHSLDGDGDGIADVWEVAHFGDLSPTASSSWDDDGLSDLEEFFYGTDPKSLDTDGDGISDSEEVTAGTDDYFTNPLNPDTDGDGVSDGDEVSSGADPNDPVPGNNLLRDAFALPGEEAGRTTGRNTFATRESWEADIDSLTGGYGGASVWWQWTAPKDGTVFFNTIGSTKSYIDYSGDLDSLYNFTGGYVELNTLLAVYELVEPEGGGEPYPSGVIGNDDFIGLTSGVSFVAVGGQTYYISVDGDDGDTGNIVLSWNYAPEDQRIQMVNDIEVLPPFLTGSAGTAIGSNMGATKEEVQNHAGNPGGKSVWWRWKAPANGTVYFDSSGSDFRTLLGVYTDNGGALTEVGGVYAESLTGSLHFTAVRDTDYYIAVDGYTDLSPDAASGNIVLSFRYVVTYHVDSLHGHDDNSGLTWSESKQTIHAAIDAAQPGDSIWVKAGTYVPSPLFPNFPRTASFLLRSAVSLYGGFPNDPEHPDPTLEDRDWKNHATTLSGVLGDGRNTLKVVRIRGHLRGMPTAGVIIDGFTITGGSADFQGSALGGFGGGIFCIYANPILRNCKIIENQATSGGGGLCFIYGSSPTIVNCEISHNSELEVDGPAVESGAGILLRSSHAIIRKSKIKDNVSFSAGGGVAVENNSTLYIENSLIAGNAANIGGGIYVDTYSNADIKNCTISRNIANYSGDGLYFAGGDGNSVVANSIVYGNGAEGAEEIYSGYVEGYGGLYVGYSNIRGGLGSISGIVSDYENIDSDPLFVNAEGSDYHLQFGSYCIDSADSTNAPETDLDGVIRQWPSNGNLDMGAYEYIDSNDDQVPDYVEIPACVSITRADASPTNVGTVHFTVSFSEPVSGVDISDFQILAPGITGACITGMTGSGMSYSVTVATGTAGDGTLQLNLVDDDSIIDATGIPLGDADDGGYTAGESYDIDKTAPAIQSTSPSDAATGHPVNAAITVTFSENINPASISAASFKLNNGSIAGIVSYDHQSMKTATFITPFPYLASYTSYSATITTDVRDLVGNAMASNYTWSFTTADVVAPTGGVTINGGASQANNSGVILTLICDDSGGTGCSQMQFSNSNSTWSTPVSFAASTNWTLSSGEGDKTVYARFRDGADNWSQAYSDSINLDLTLPTGIIGYSTTAPTNVNVVASLTTSEPVTITNNNGVSTYTFTENGSFTFQFVDAAGNTGSATATVSNIDKTSPTGIIGYSTTAPTNADVVATLTANEPVTMTNNNGASTYVFTANGSFTFQFVDAAGNAGSATATVSNIDKTGPTGTIGYSTTAPTNADVVATLTANESVTVTNNNGASIYTFTANGSFTFQFVDAAGNGGSATATVSNIDKTSPTVTIGSSAPSPTNISPIPFTVGFSEAVSDFVQGDISVTNGTIASFSGSGTSYSIGVTPAGANVTVTVSVAAAVAHDGAGNGNTAADPMTVAYLVLSPAAYYVSPEGFDDPAHGSADGSGAWKTLHYALARINEGASGNYTLQVSAGIYSVSSGETDTPLFLTQGNVKIFGERAAILDGSGAQDWITGIVVLGSDAVVENLRIKHFEAGIGIYDPNGSVTVQNNLITDCAGQAIDISGNPTILNNTLAGTGTGDGIFVSTGSAPDIRYNIITGFGIGINDAGGITPEPVFDYNDLWSNGQNQVGCTAGAHSLSVDPLFADPSAGDFHLSAASLCIDATDRSDAGIDLDGTVRPSAATTWDMGAYEVMALDSDSDGLFDYVEARIGTDPDNPDTDSDSLSDGEEVNTHHTNPLLSDTDGDTISDSAEIEDGTDPTDPSSFRLPVGAPPRFITPAPQGRDLRGMVNRRYRFVVEAQAEGGRCTGLTYALSDSASGVEMVPFNENGCDKARVELAAPSPGDYPVNISVSDGSQWAFFGPYTVTVTPELILTPTSRSFLRESIGGSVSQLQQAFEIAGGTALSAGDGYYRVEILSNALSGPEPHMAEYVEGVFRFVFDTTGKADGACHLRITDAWGFKTSSEEIHIRTVVYTLVASGQVNASTGGSLVTEPSDPGLSAYTGTTIEVPPGAASVGDVHLSFSVAETGAPFVSESERKGLVIRLEATDSADNKVTFGAVVTVRIPYGDLIGPGEDPHDFVFIHYNEQTGRWEEIETHVDTTNRMLWFETTGFSLFAVADPTVFVCPVTGGDTQMHYKMISIPGEALTRNICDHLLAIYGDYDISQWRLYAFDANSRRYVEATSESYGRFGEEFSLSPGRGFWLIARSDGSIPVNGLSTSSDAGTQATFHLYPGWNMVSQPWDETVNLINRGIEVSADQSAWVRINDPTNDLTGRIVWKFKGLSATAGSWYDPVYLNVAGQGLEPYRSYWIKNFTDAPVFFRMTVPEMTAQGITVPLGDLRDAGIEGEEAPPAPPGGTAEVRPQIVPTAAGGGGLCFIETAAQGWRIGLLGLGIVAVIGMGLVYRRRPVR